MKFIKNINTFISHAHPIEYFCRRMRQKIMVEYYVLLNIFAYF